MNAGVPMVRKPIYVICLGKYGKGMKLSTTPSEISTEYTVFTRNRLATRSMLAITCRPRATTLGRWENFESTSTIWATAFVAGAALPIAMPRSASLSARASLTPSPVIATVWPLLCRACTIAFFCSGSTRPRTSISSRASASSSTLSGRLRASIYRGMLPPVRPTFPAIAATVPGLSPEITRHLTPCSRNHAKVSRASSRIDSEQIISDTGTIPGFTVSAGSLPCAFVFGAYARRRTRDPFSAKASMRLKTSGYRLPGSLVSALIAAWEPERSTSGAPKNHWEPSAYVMELHFRADEKGVRDCMLPGLLSDGVPVLLFSPSRTARAVAFGDSSLQISESARLTVFSSGYLGLPVSASLLSPRFSMLSKTIPPSVIVPVLSRFRASTRARVSTASSSWTRVF